MGIVALILRHFSSDQFRVAENVRTRAGERATADATSGAQKCHRRLPAITSTAYTVSVVCDFADPPGPLPGVYGSLSAGRR
jgi:hypothetical protein